MAFLSNPVVGKYIRRGLIIAFVTAAYITIRLTDDIPWNRVKDFSDEVFDLPE